MSTQLRSPRRPESRPARSGGLGPPGKPKRTRPSISLVVGAVDARVATAMRTAGRSLTRRQFIRRAGEAAFVTGLTLSRVMWTTAPSRADGTSACGPHPNGCGSSPICPDSVCHADPDGPGQNCDLNCGCGGVRKRVNCSSNSWSDVSAPCCGGDNASNCWRENCSGTCKRCCDCCVPPSFTDGADCNQCGGTNKRRCTCRSIVNSC